MRKIAKRIVFLTLTLALLWTETVFAKPKEQQRLSGLPEEESVLLPETIKSSIGKETVATRSKALASALCVITNTEKGIIHVYAETLMFQSVDWAALTIYL